MRRYKAVPTTLTAEQQCGARVLGELREAAALPALAELDSALASDPVIGPRLDHEVTSIGAGGQTWQGASMILLLVDRAVPKAPGFVLRDSVRDALIGGWIDFLRRPSDSVTVVVALREFDASELPIEVSPGLEIDLLSEEEMAVAIALGGGLSSNLSLDERTVSGKTFGIRMSFESRLLIDGEPAAIAEEDDVARREVQDRSALVLDALRLFKAGVQGGAGRNVRKLPVRHHVG
jgi:hypothetical protein